MALDRQRLRILFAVAEAYPFAKVGGLADVGGALPRALARLGHEVRLLLPGYFGLGTGRAALSLEIPMGPATEHVRVRHHGTHGGVGVYTVASARYFSRNLAYGYADDDVVPFVLFSKAVVAFAALADWVPDLLHCNDWHLGLAPHYARRGPQRAILNWTGVVFTIHNLAYQGHFGPEIEALIGLEGGGEGNLLARGIAHADIVNTVSRRYLEEILTPEGGRGLDDLLHSRLDDLRGILNGVDYEEFDPAADPHIAARYDGSSRAGKRRNKLALQERSGLTVDPGAPLLGMVARLVDQKGIDLLCASLDEIVALGAQVVVMGVGDERYERALTAAAARHAGAIAYHATDEEAPARLVYAGSDCFLAPSAFEPCGLAPLIALRYASIPIVRRTGGLAETIADYRRGQEVGLGFTFKHQSPRHLVRAVKRALKVYRRGKRWRALQRRAMAADFSWERSSRQYEQLYRQALAERRVAVDGQAARTALQAGARLPLGRRVPPAVPLALMHHANQSLIADGYEGRQGITEVVEGYAAVLRLHEGYGIPAHLHLSGTAVEAIAWHAPHFLVLVRRLRAKGLLELVGGTYAENVLPLFSQAFNRRQLDEAFWLYGRHLRCAPTDLQVCWVTERVWDTAKLAPLLTDRRLANGGYRVVPLDDRLLYPTGGSDAGGPRADFDATGPYATTAPEGAGAPAARANPTEAWRPHRIAGGNGLVMAPIAANLRYWIPPASSDDWRCLEETVVSLAQRVGQGEEGDTILVYADDLERTAGVGGWDASALGRYDAFLRWVAARQDVTPVLLSSWLADRPPRQERALEPGTFCELARDWGAGEDYRGWWEGAAWAPYRLHLVTAQVAIEEAERAGADRRLLALAWKHLLASTYETAWHDPDEAGHGRAPAPWARALASHARACLPIIAAARWFARPARPPAAEVLDIDGDGEDELVLANEQLYAVLSPERGGRLIYLFALTPQGGALTIGNPSDDWNFQQELNRYMDQPANHPGALADVGHEHDRYRVSTLEASAAGAFVELTNVAGVSALFGLRKGLYLANDAPALVVTYRAPSGPGGLASEACLSPDYYRLLREGRSDLQPYQGQTWRGFRNGEVAVWLGLDRDEETAWAEPAQTEAGHGLNLRVRADNRTFHLLIGCGETDDARCKELLGGGEDARAERRAEALSAAAADLDD